MEGDKFASRAYRSFWDLLVEFGDALVTTFPDCGDTKDWVLYMKNVVVGDDHKMRDGLQRWCDGMNRPLAKGAAKYAKAIQSITGAPATVFHAISYRDMAAADASFEELRTLQLPAKLRSGTMDAAAKDVFWRYLEELNGHAFSYARKPIPRVPTSDEIAADIARRKAAASGGPPNDKDGSNVLHHGLRDVWTQLLLARGEPADDVGDALASRLGDALAQSSADGTLADGCKRHEPDAFAELAAQLPELGSGTPDAVQWELLDKAMGLVTMERAISAPMMRSIESVANQLMSDISTGKADLGTVDLETLGRQVLSQTSAGDVSNFAASVDQLLPTLQGLVPPGASSADGSAP
jgi:hypothetical protein